MSRHRSIRRSRKKKNRGFSFLPENLQVFLARGIVDVLALAALAGGLFLAAALFSYDPADPSWNTATVGPDAADQVSVLNWAGRPGAWISDFLAQTIGIGGAALAAGLVLWGVRIYRRDPLSPLWARLTGLCVAAIALSLATAQVPAQGWLTHPYLGGTFGSMGFEALRQVLLPLLPHGYAPLAATLTTGFIASVAFLFAAAVSREEIAAFFEAVAGVFISAYYMISAVCRGFADWVTHYNDPDYREQGLNLFSSIAAAGAARIAPLVSAREDAAEDDDEDDDGDGDDDVEEDDEEMEHEEPRRRGIPVVAPRKGGAAKKKGKGGKSQKSLDFGDEEWELPALDLLQEAPDGEDSEVPSEAALRKNAELLQNVLADFGIQGEVVSIHPGPVVTLYELEPAPGIKTSRIISLSDDIARSMAAVSVRCAVIPGRNVIGIELPNKRRQIVYMRELLESDLYECSTAKLPLVLGKDISGQPIMADLAKMPHLLVAGTTGSGKSVAVNTMILSLLYRLSPEQCRLIMIDPKMLELSVYDEIPHLLSPVVTEPGKAVVALKWTVHEMEERYRAMSKLGVRNIEGYNTRMREAIKKGETITKKVQTGFDPETGEAEYEEQDMELAELPYIVVIVDEFADLMLVAGKDVESAIQRLAQMARAAGIHLIMATQRPSVDVITGVIKANFPTRISFQVTSKIDSRTILGEGGAEQLLGMGDMLYMAPGGRITRVHGPFVSDQEVEDVTEFLRDQAEPDYIEDVTEGGDGSDVMNALFGGGNDVDELYDQAVAVVAREGKASTSFIQRHLQIGYNRAARIIEEMERQGVVSKATATGKREVLVGDYSDV